MKRLLGLMALLMALIIAGCGGGGGGGGSSSGSNVGLFFTDNMNTGYDHVWVKVEKVELLTASGAVTVFDDPAGAELDVRALNDSGTNKFFFCNRDTVPAGQYTGVRVTLDGSARIFPTGSPTANIRTFSGLDGSGNKVLTETFGVAKTFGVGLTYQVIDFKLDDWTENGSNIDISGSGLDDFSATDPDFLDHDNHHDEDYKGTVNGLSGGSFRLTREHGQIEVTFDASTTIYNDSGAPNPSLSNGDKVEVRGTFDTSTGKLLAATIKIDDDSDDDPHEAKGIASNLNEGAGTFTLKFTETNDFLPGSTSTTVTLLDGARLFSHGGIALTKAEFFAALDALPAEQRFVEVEGSYDGTNFAATKAKIEDESGGDHEGVEIKGTPSNLDSLGGTFDVTLSEWEGFSGHSGQVVGVQTNLATEFRDENGATITKTQFFASLPSFAVKVEGSFSGDVLVARNARLKSSSGGGGGGGGQAEAQGSVFDINSVGQTFKVSLTSWSGFSGTLGQTITVNSNGATYRDDEGNTVNATQFFALLSNGMKVEAEGSYSGGVLTATKVKIED